ncbi:MAG: hypothetical protein BWY72_02327 [Bacteroidetes bacterium ADurb.Bin416]|nr:MAG: hypothetical protein BWY72_02327 [Bacteroidetes bacterium ADurb.Bin416]
MLDGTAGTSTVRIELVTGRIFPAFTGIALPSYQVHRHGHGLVGLTANGTVRHGTGHKPLHNGLSRFNSVQFDRLSRFVRKKIPQENGMILLINSLHIVQVLLPLTSTGSNLETGDGFRVPGMQFALFAPGVYTLVFRLAYCSTPESSFVHHQGIAGNIIHGDAFHLGGSTFKVALQDGRTDAHRLKNLSAPVTAQGRNAHFRQDLEQALVDRFDVVFFSCLVIRLDTTLGHQVIEYGKCQVGIDHTGSIAKQKGEMHHLPGLGTFHHNIDLHAFAATNQVVMHR